MVFDKFIQPKTVEIGDRKFVISMIPSVDALRIHNIVSKAIAENGLLGITQLPPEIDKQLLSYVAWADNDMHMVIDTETLINDVFKGRVGDIKAIVIEMVKLNFSFLITGDLLERLVDREATDSAS